MTSSRTTSAGHLKWPGMRAAIGLAQYFALFSWLLSLLVSLEQCLSTPPQLVSCEVVSCGRVVDTTWRRGQSRPAYRLHRLQEKLSKLRSRSYALRSRPVRHPQTRRCLLRTSAHPASPTRFTIGRERQTWTPQRLGLHSCSTSNNR